MGTVCSHFDWFSLLVVWSEYVYDLTGSLEAFKICLSLCSCLILALTLVMAHHLTHGLPAAVMGTPINVAASTTSLPILVCTEHVRTITEVAKRHALLKANKNITRYICFNKTHIKIFCYIGIELDRSKRGECSSAKTS